MTDESPNPNQEQLLAELPPEQWQHWRRHLEYIDIGLGAVLYEPGDTLSHVYFQITAMVALLYVMGNGESVEIVADPDLPPPDGRP